MTFTAADATQLRKLLDKIGTLLEKVESTTKTKAGKRSADQRTRQAREPRSRVRRTGKELTAFRKMLKTERRRGVPVADLAKKHKISTAYIYTNGHRA